MKKHFAFLTLFLLMITALSHGQEKPVNIADFNLPPGAKIMAKKFEYVDYSYKLNSAYSNESVNKNYLFKFTDEEFNNLKNKNNQAYLYYQNANSYFISLSDKVKKAFTVEELWYIYIYDTNLKNKLSNIK